MNAENEENQEKSGKKEPEGKNEELTKKKKPGKFEIEKLDEKVVPDDVALHSENNQI